MRGRSLSVVVGGTALGRARWRAAALTLMAAWLLLAGDAHAAKACFGTGERLHHVASVYATDAAGRELYLARKLTSWCFFFPYWLRDDGYVLGITDDRSTYLPMPEGEALARMQRLGWLPNPLPPWDPGLTMLVFEGYYFWLAAPFIAFLGVIGARRARLAGRRGG
jgi:hypothetical protein